MRRNDENAKKRLIWKNYGMKEQMNERIIEREDNGMRE